MPLYEYRCRSCSKRFEALVMGKDGTLCPGCRGEDLEKLFSTFAVGNGGARSTGAAGALPDALSPCGTCGDPRGPGSCTTD
ncbi:MAG: hypothetical protein AUI47_04265 [Acidobacteria bacterium 13_1_40CM_2_68_5]|nr:MAG: hypothetical protein AUI47_04265 [Acidobacteria bacterium 13_1_40CM_2_68_5]OLE67554.1 MAG: hypothetical protein AUG09_01905 [Acidobacteria bacterium 13_1_20CM_2_68_7]